MVGTFWQLWETNPLWVIKPTIICCVSVKWQGGAQYTFSLSDFKGYKAGSENPRPLLKKLHKFIEEADIVIGQNHKRFDMKMINTEFLKYGFNPPSPYKMIDTLIEAKRYFRFPSNKLDYLAHELGIGRKLDHEGEKLWKRCMAGDMRAWALMKRYNAHDVRLTEGVYTKFLPWIENHPAAKMKALDKSYGECDNCGKEALQRHGQKWHNHKKYWRFQCMACGKTQPAKKRFLVKE